MRRVHIEDVDTYMGPASVKRPLSTELETEGIAINYFELDPGESFAFGYHSHAGQEEVFYVLQGTATFETNAGAAARAEANGKSIASEDEDATVGPTADADRIEVEVEAGEAIRFAPGEYQQGHNENTERVVALAIGAPRDAGETDIRRECPPCGEDTPQEIEMTEDHDSLVTRCIECGTETGRFD